MNQNKLIEEYYSTVCKEKIKKYGQFFTPYNIAKFMSDWVFEINPNSVLDPAIGNNIFIGDKAANLKKCKGYDIDEEVVSFFRKKEKYEVDVEFTDYLLNGWDEQWEGIIANPPYNRFQNIDNKDEIRELFIKNLNVELNGYTNQYALFLLKSLFELKENGRLAYIIPTEFMNLEYGSVLRQALCEKGYLDKIIIFDTKSNKNPLFYSAVTTSCIVFVEKKYHEYVSIYSADYLEDTQININEMTRIKNKELINIKNWKSVIFNEKFISRDLVLFDKYIKVSRGIATGDNEYFIFNEEKKKKYCLSDEHFYQIICKAPYLKKPFFTEIELDEIKNKNKDYLLFDGTLCKDESNDNYLSYGLKSGILNKYLVASRKIWYESEKKAIAPIWICGNSREKIKVVRNVMGIRNLTTFHGIFIKEKYKEYLDIVFCYLLTNLSQELLSYNKKEYAGGLNKFQPGDIQRSLTVDFEKITSDDQVEIEKIYNTLKIKNNVSEIEIKLLDEIFKKYL